MTVRGPGAIPWLTAHAVPPPHRLAGSAKGVPPALSTHTESIRHQGQRHTLPQPQPQPEQMPPPPETKKSQEGRRCCPRRRGRGEGLCWGLPHAEISRLPYSPQCAIVATL